MDEKMTLIESLKDLGEAEWEVMKFYLKDATSQFMPVVLDEAKSAVVLCAEYALPGTAKKEIAFGQITENLIMRGITVGVQVAVSMIYRMIEVAYEWFIGITGTRSGAPATGGALSGV